MEKTRLKLWQPLLRKLTVKTLKCQPWRILVFVLFFPLDLVTPIFNVNRRYICSAVLWGMTFGKGRDGGLAHIRTATEETELEVEYRWAGYVLGQALRPLDEGSR